MASGSQQEQGTDEQSETVSRYFPTIRSYESAINFRITQEDRDRFDTARDHILGPRPNGHHQRLSRAQVLRFLLDTIEQMDSAVFEEGLDNGRAAALKRFQDGLSEYQPKENPTVTTCPACGRDLEQGEAHDHIFSCDEVGDADLEFTTPT